MIRHSRPRLRVALRTLLVLAIVAGSSLTAVNPVRGDHSVPDPRWYWDYNEDRARDPWVYVQPAGLDWTQGRLDDFYPAIVEWRTTVFKPYLHDPSINDFYIDGRDPPEWCGCTNCWSYYTEFTSAVTCKKKEPVYGGCSSQGCLYMAYRLTEVNTYLHREGSRYTAVQGRPPSFNFGGPDTKDWRFRGIAAHELGHWLRLRDLDNVGQADDECTSGVGFLATMCPPRNYSESIAVASLHQDDIDAADVVY